MNTDFTSKMVNADFTRLITQKIYDAINQYNSLDGIKHSTIEVIDWKEKENEVTIKITDGNESEVTTDTREAIYFAIKLLLCTATLINQAVNMSNIAEIED